jgi:drug/metabolite transporter (DMT)-like permease
VKIGCLTAGFLGVVLAIGTKGLGGGEWIGYTAAFISVGAFVGYTIAMRHIAANATVENLLLPPFLTVGLVGFAGVVREGGFSLNAAIAVVVAAALLNLVANFLYNKALQVTVATNVMQLHYTQIVWGAIIGYAIWGEKPTWNLIAGSAIIIASGLVVATQAHRAEIPEQEKALAESEALGLRVKEALSKK